MHWPSLSALLLIAVVALLLFGPNKLPELGRAFGKTLREFKKGASDIMNDDEPDASARDNARQEIAPPPRQEIPPAEVTVHDALKEGGDPAPERKRRLPD